MPIFYFCYRCKDFRDADIIYTIDIAERDKIYFFECAECNYVWMEHDKWDEEDDEKI